MTALPTLVSAVLLALAGLPTLPGALVPSPGEQQADARTSVSSSAPGTDVADEVDVVVDEVDLVLPEAADAVVEAAGEHVLDDPEALEVVTTDDVVVAEVLVEDRVVSPVVESEGFQTLGVTWTEGGGTEPDDIRIRTRGTDGWTDWVQLDVADDAADAGTVDAERAVRAGTDPLWVGEAQAVQLSFAAQEDSGPPDLQLALVASDEAPLPADAAVETAAAPGAGSRPELAQAVFAQPAAVMSTTAMPRIIRRAEWGSAPQSCKPDVASALVGAVVHHTAGSNSYASVAQAMQQIRNDQRYHMVSRGWCDLGYNFVVDKWGNIYEGRAESLTKAVIGVHAGGFNTGTLGVSMLGTYSAAPSAATQRAVAQIIGFRLGAYGVDPVGTMSYRTLGGENSSVPAGTTKVLPRVFAHRDVAYTSCPGDGGYRALGAVRSMASDHGYALRFTQANAVVQALYEDILLRPVDPSGLQTWSASLAGGTGQPALVSSLTWSEEYVRMRITQAYEEVLGRSPDSSGMAYWYGRIVRGTATVDDVKRRFYDSAEYFKRSGGTPEGYVSLLYRTMFERDASAREQEHWSARIVENGRGAVVDAIWFSFEAARHRAGGYYRAYLEREPDAAGQSGWATVLLQQGEHAVRVGIAGSEEYRQLAIRTYG